MFEYLNDIEFLQQLDKQPLHTHYIKLVLLSFDEKPIREIQGTASAGSISVNSSSAVRRTVSLTMLASEENSNIENIENEISINKKVKVYVGLKNTMRDYAHYGEIIWFPQGLFVLSSATISRSTSGWTISISGKDKMCLLDGTAGGTLPASVTFHESFIENDDGSITVVYPTIYKIIYEAVNHWGGEPIENIIITDLEEKCKMLVRYMGSGSVWFSNGYESMSFTQMAGFPHRIEHGQDAGYKETDFTYPGELVLNAGDTIASLLDKITKTLGNYEFFYDIEGRFVFQQIKNYLNTGSPLLELQPDNYVKSYNNAKFLYALTELDTTTTIARNPKYENVKNDFYVWGARKGIDGSTEYPIRYHMAIDTKPELELCLKYMYALKDKETGLIIDYKFFDNEVQLETTTEKLEWICGPAPEWREELYRHALQAQVANSQYNAYYDSELLAEWRKLYDPNNAAWAYTEYEAIDPDGNKILRSAPYWNPDVFENPGKLDFWLDFIDTGSEIGKYSVDQIGRRSKVITDNKVASVYNKEVPDIVFLDGYDEEKIAWYTNYGQLYFILTEQNYDLFSISSTGTSCFDRIREMLYQNLNYNTTVTITCLPKYYIEPNNIIFIQDKKSNISGNYLITQFTLPLTYNGTMSITATEVLTRV